LLQLSSYTESRSQPAPLPYALRNTVTLNSYLGLFELCYYFWFTYNTLGYLWWNGRWPLNRVWCTLNIFSPSGYTFLVNMEPIPGNNNKREPILGKITSDSFFSNPLSPFRQGPLPLHVQWQEIPSRALHLQDAGPVGETTYVLCRNYCKWIYMRYQLQRSQIIDHHSWPDFLYNCLGCMYNCDGQLCLFKPRPQNRIPVPVRGSFQNVRRAPPPFIREFPQGAEKFCSALIQCLIQCLATTLVITILYVFPRNLVRHVVISYLV